MNLVNFLAGLFLAQLLFVIGADGAKVSFHSRLGNRDVMLVSDHGHQAEPERE